jgi:hypothetical protein
MMMTDPMLSFFSSCHETKKTILNDTRGNKRSKDEREEKCQKDFWCFVLNDSFIHIFSSSPFI